MRKDVQKMRKCITTILYQLQRSQKCSHTNSDWKMYSDLCHFQIFTLLYTNYRDSWWHTTQQQQQPNKEIGAVGA